MSSSDQFYDALEVQLLPSHPLAALNSSTMTAPAPASASAAPQPSVLDHSLLSSPAQRPAPYFHLDQGQGGIYSLPFHHHNGTEVDHIGTHSCWTCVGIYVRLDEKRCFVAHIDSHTHAYDEAFDWIPEGSQQRNQLKDYVKALLESFLGEIWRAKSPEEQEEVRRSVVLVCPRQKVAHPATGAEAIATGTSTVRGIREFFSLPDVASLGELAHGFVVNHRTQVVTRLGWEQGKMPTTTQFLEYERAGHVGMSNRGEKDHAALDEHPAMLSPESAGFTQVPGRPFTLVFEYDGFSWRKMKSTDFGPFCT